MKNLIPLSEHQKIMQEFAANLKKEILIVVDKPCTLDNCLDGEGEQLIPLKKWQVNKLLKSGVLPGRKLGKHWCFLLGDFNRIIAESDIQITMEEIKPKKDEDSDLTFELE